MKGSLGMRNWLVVGPSVVIVEALTRGQKLRLIAEVPLADDARCVPLLLEQLGDCHFVRIESFGV